MTRGSLALLLAAVASLVAATQPIADTDLFWQLATGRETLAHGIVRADVFSWTVNGAPVSTDQWLGQVVLWTTYSLADWRGIAIVRVVAVFTLVGLVAWNAGASRPRPLALVLAAMPALILTRVLWVERPELLGLVAFAALLVALRAARDGSDRALMASFAILVAWANVHGSFALGVVVTVLVCVEGAMNDRARRRSYVVYAAGALVASVLTPAGLGTWTAPGIHLLSPPREIQEWNVIDLRTPLGAGYGLLVATLFALAFTGPPLRARELVVLIPIGALSLTAARQAPLLAIAAAPLLAERVSALTDQLRRRAGATEGPRAAWDPIPAKGSGARRTAGGYESASLPRSREGFGRDGAALAVLAPAVVLAAAALAIAPSAPDLRAYPAAALTVVPNGNGVLARYEWGGFLMWSGVPVFVDGRLTPYSGGVLDDYQRIIAAKPGWREAVARRGVRALLVAPSDPVAVRAIDLGWPVRARSETFVVIAVP
jgi:hypothetical protein